MQACSLSSRDGWGPGEGQNSWLLQSHGRSISWCESQVSKATTTCSWLLQVWLFRQRAGRPPAGAVAWDYHVFVAQRRPGLPSLIWDLDRCSGRASATDSTPLRPHHGCAELALQHFARGSTQAYLPPWLQASL